MGACLSEDLIEYYLNGNCSSQEQQAVEAHLTTCGNCRQRIESTRSEMASSGGSDMARTDEDPANRVTEEITVDQDGRPTKSMSAGLTAPGDGHTDSKGFGSAFEGYQIIDQIGEGGMGTVWRAFQLSTQRNVALKVLGMGTLGSKRARTRFEREVELAARLEHPSIARIYDSGLRRGSYYYAMELFEGEHLDKYIGNHQLTERDILKLVHAVCQGVQYAHQRGVIHRDLKPSNIIVTDDGQPHIVDFGLAKTLLESDKSVTLSLEGDVAGTPAFMSPEQAGGNLDAIDTRTDVYSLGAILYNVLTSRWPYDLSGSHYEVLRNIQEQEPIRPSRIVPRFDADIEAILLKALAKKPDERYQSVAELANDIQYWLDGLAVMARSVSSLYLLKKFIVRHRATSTIVGLLLVIIVSTAFISLYSYSQARRALRRSQAEQQVYKKVADRNLAFTRQVAFALFLELWHSGKIAGGGENSIPFARSIESREYVARRFLLDPRPLVEKKADYQARLSADHPSFWEFIIGEYHHKNGNKAEAIKAYKRCIAIEQRSTEWDNWFRNTAVRKLSELLTDDIPLKSDPDTNRAE